MLLAMWSKASGTPSVGRPPKVFQTIQSLNSRNTFLRWLYLVNMVGESSIKWSHSRLSYLVDLGQLQLSHLLGHLLINLTWFWFIVVRRSKEPNS